MTRRELVLELFRITRLCTADEMPLYEFRDRYNAIAATLKENGQ